MPRPAPNPTPGPTLLPRAPALRRSTLALLDAALATLSLGGAFLVWLLIREKEIPDKYESLFYHAAPAVVGLRLFLYWALGLYRAIARRAGSHELLMIALANAIATGAIVAFNLATPGIHRLGSYPLNFTGAHVLRIPWGIVFIDWMLSMILIGGAWLLRHELATRIASWGDGGKRVLIIGAGDTGEQVARDLAATTRGAFRPVAYIDPDPAMVGSKIHGVRVAGDLHDLAKVIAAHKIDEIVIALQRPTPRILREMVEHCRSARLGFKIIPPLDSLMAGGIQIGTLRTVEIEDLLGRDPVNLDAANRPQYLKGKIVLVTGAGGSIGRELCRQAIAQKPEKLVMLGRGENSIFEALVELEPQARQAGVKLVPVVGDIRDEGFVQELFETHKPNAVFHAAAHKHVHFMEAQPAEAVKNNILGTLCVAMSAVETGVERFILVSTDKAVRPTGIMGASKRVAEMIVGAMNEKAGGAFLSVRFGNVLGSRGSVIPTFRRQIEQGGPVTVTDPEVTRYFMTTSEAVHLMIQAAAQGEGGEVFILDMGKPIKIADLARNLITLSGLEPETDIAIVYTGLRPGEKLTEEILTKDEGVNATENGKIFVARTDARPWSELQKSVKKLVEAAEENDEAAIREGLKELIPDYQPQDEAKAAAKAV